MSAAGGMQSDAAFTGTKPVEARHRIDEAKLDAWLAAHVADYRGPLTVRQFKGGQSNPTYRLDTPGRAYVLRRQPFGKLLPSAHAVDREFRVITALAGAAFPVARPYALCVDERVIGAMFYVMAMVEGRVLWNGALPDCERAERGAVYRAAIATLARLHACDPAALKLADYGKPGNYCARQIDRWTRQYRASATQEIAAMDFLIGWLPKTVPAQERVSIVHGDYRLDNLVFAAHESQVAAVLDWELSTLGDPLADFTYFLMNWVMPSEGRSGIAGLDLAALGIPSIEQAAAHYCALTKREGLPAFDWYLAYNLFRMAAILQGIAGRIRDGTAASAGAAAAIRRVAPLAEMGLAFARKAGG